MEKISGIAGKKVKKNIEVFGYENCPIRNILDRFGDKWSILIILALGEEEVLRFKQLNYLIKDISQKMLTVTLRTLESDGLVKRKVYPEIPPKVEYSLTDMGKSLLPHINNLVHWAHQNMSEIKETRLKQERINAKKQQTAFAS